MPIVSWLTPHWAWLLLAYPAWQAADSCPLLALCAAGTGVVMVVLAAALAMLRELALVSTWSPPD